MGFINDQHDRLLLLHRLRKEIRLEALVGSGRAKLLGNRAQEAIRGGLAGVGKEANEKLAIEKLLVKEASEAGFAGPGITKDSG